MNCYIRVLKSYVVSLTLENEFHANQIKLYGLNYLYGIVTF